MVILHWMVLYWRRNAGRLVAGHWVGLVEGLGLHVPSLLALCSHQEKRSTHAAFWCPSLIAFRTACLACACLP